MAQDLTNFEAALKETYGPGLRNAVNNSSVILTEVSRKAEHTDFQGKQAVWSLHHGRSTATGSVAEGGTLPTAANQQFEDPRQTVKYIYHTVQVSGPVLAASKSDKGSFARAIKAEMDGAEVDLKNDVARQLFGRATVKSATPTVIRTGAVARCGTTTAANLVVLHSTTTVAEMRAFFVGMLVDIIDGDDGSDVAADRSISAIDVSGKTITVSGAVITTDDTHYVVRANSYDNEILGLRALVNDNTGDKVDATNAVLVHGLSSTSVPAWASVKVGSTTTPISEDLLEQAFDKVETDGDGGQPNLILGSYEQRRVLANKLQTQKRYEGKEMTLTAGWRGLNVARGTYVADRYCPDNDAFLIRPSQIGWFVLEDFGWDDDDGRVLLRATTDAVTARFKGYVQLAALNRNSHCRISMAAA